MPPEARIWDRVSRVADKCGEGATVPSNGQGRPKGGLLAARPKKPSPSGLALEDHPIDPVRSDGSIPREPECSPNGGRPMARRPASCSTI
jgi:hypothetical protein